MKHALTLLIALAVTLMTAPASAQDLWNGTAVGMTTAEVSAVQPGVQKTLTANEKAPLYGGATCELKWETSLGDGAYAVCFYFKADHLCQVMLRSANPSRQEFDRAVNELRARYGQEASLQKTPIGYKADWRTNNGVLAMLSFVSPSLSGPPGLGPSPGILNINYRAEAGCN